MFRGVEVGAWYRIRVEGRSVFGKILRRRGRSYSFQYLHDDGRVATGEVSRSDVCGRLGDQFVAPLESAIAAAQTPLDTIAPGDWHLFQYEGNTVAGVVYRSQGDQYTLFILHGGIPTFVTLPRGSVGPREERLTSVFRKELAKNPNYLLEWVAKAGKFPARLARTPETTRAGRRSSRVQKRLFPK